MDQQSAVHVLFVSLLVAMACGLEVGDQKHTMGVSSRGDVIVGVSARSRGSRTSPLTSAGVDCPATDCDCGWATDSTCHTADICNTQCCCPLRQPPAPVCPQGIAAEAWSVCCAKSCGRCGGDDCGSLPGGAERCCSDAIIRSQIVCKSASDVACIVPDSAPPSEPGCYFKQLEGTAKCAAFPAWQPDVWGRENVDSWSDEKKCLLRQKHHDAWCGAFSQWIFIRASTNLYRQVAGVGGFGGTCTCPDGQVYHVGDNMNHCGSLACQGGTPSSCESRHDEFRSGYEVICTSPRGSVECGTGCMACSGSGTCTMCKEGRFLSADNQCLKKCYPGSFENITSRSCVECKGRTRRRRSNSVGSVSEQSCTNCPRGHISKSNSDECQNIQETCSPDDCNSCLSCLTKPSMQDAWGACLEELPDRQCVHPGLHWCPAVMEELHDCQSMGMGCYFRLQCHSPCICKAWKDINCGGDFTNSGTCTVSSTQTASKGMMQRSEDASSANAGSGLDAALAGKCM